MMSSSPSQRRSTQRNAAQKQQSIAPAQLAAAPSPAFFAGGPADFAPNLLPHAGLTPVGAVPPAAAAAQPTAQRVPAAGTKRKAASLAAQATGPAAMDPFIQPKPEGALTPTLDASSSAAAPGPSTAAPGSAGDESPRQPPAKKSRTNTPWTPAEEKRLKQMRDVGSTWSDIAKEFPNRTEGSVKKHWYKDMHYAEFAEDESTALLEAIREYDANKWKVIGQKVGKPAKACEQYAKEHFQGKL